MSITSANPVELNNFVTNESARRTPLAETLANLKTQQATVKAACAYRQVSGTSLTSAETTLGNMATNETFVKTVHDTLLTADVNSMGVASVNDSQVQVALTAAGVGAPPPPVVVEAPTMMGEPPTSGFVDDPICAANGNFLQVDKDLAFPGWTAVLDVVRAYNSLGADTVGAFGPGWTSAIDLRIDHVAGATTRVRLADGAVVPFVEGGRDGRLQAAGARIHELTVLDDGWILHEGHTKAWRFDADGRFTGGTAGAATLVVRHEGERIVELTEQRSGRWVRYEWRGMRVASAMTSDGREVVYRYNDDGVLIGVDRPSGTVTYDVSGNLLVSVTDADGVRLAQNVFDDDGRVSEQTNEFGRTTRYEYAPLGTTLVSDTVEGPRNAFTHDARGNLTAMIDGQGRSMRLAYDDENHVTSVTDRDGARRRFSYDDGGNITRRVDPDGAWAEWAWDDLGRLVAETHRNHAVTTYGYTGEQRRPSRIVEPGGGTYVIELADTELPLAVTDPDGVVTRYEWDDDGQLVAIVDALDNRTELAFDAIGMPTQVVDATGVVTEMTNDTAGRLLQVLVAGTGASFEYTAAGRPTSGVDSESVSWAAVHGPNGKLSVFSDGVGSEVRYEWDVFGNLAAVTAPDGARFEHRYDNTGGLVATIDPDGRESTQEHDPEGRPVKVTDAAGRTWSRTTDQLGRTTELVTPDGAKTQYSYHVDGQVSRVRHPDGTTVTTEIDDLGRLRAIVDEAGGRFEFDYTTAGRLSERRWPSGRLQRWTYDAAGRMTAMHDGTGNTVAELTLDPHGRVLAADTPDGRIDCAYDAAGEIVGIAGPEMSTVLERDTAGRVRAVVDGEGARSAYRLDARGLVAEAVDPAGLVSQFAHDVRGRLESTTAANGDLTSFGYDRTGFLQQVTDPTGTMRRILDPTGVSLGHRFDDGSGIDHTLDAMGRTTALTAADGATVAEYGYDARGRMIEARNPASDATTTLDWDPAGRLTSVTSPTGRLDIDRDADGVLAAWHTDDAHTVVARDAAGRLLGLDDSQAGSVERPDRPQRQRDRAGRIIATEHGDTYHYDHAGRLVEAVSPEGVRRSFTYGSDGLLQRETGPAGITLYRRGFLGRIDSVLGPDGVETAFFYDSAGRRVGATASDGTVTQWFWDAAGDLVTIERRDAEGRITRTEVGYDALGRPFSIDDTPIVWDDALSGNPARIGDRRYLHLAGRSRSAEPGSTWFTPPADPWGHRADDESRPHVGMHGHLAAAGLVWMGARIYDPSTREFLSPDPLMAVAGRNGSAGVYSYGFLDPVNFADPSGMRPISQEEFEALKAQEEGGRLGQAWTAIKEDPWGTLAMVAVTAVGVALVATGVGTAIGAGILIGVAVTAGSGIATGTFSPRGVALGGALGAIPGGNTLRGAVLVGAGTGAGGEIIMQATSGEPMNWTNVAISTGFGAVGGAALHGVTSRLGGARPTVDTPAAPTAPVSSSTGGARFVVDSAGNTVDLHPPVNTGGARFVVDSTGTTVDMGPRLNTGSRPIVLGEDMRGRVIPAANAYGADYYQPPPFSSDAASLAHNRYWVNEQMNQGRGIIDVGPAPGRANYPNPTSPWYQMERDEVARRAYPYYTQRPAP